MRGELVDVAPVDQPAYMDTSTGLRSLAERREMDLAHIEELSRSNELASLIKTPPVVIDLGASGSTGRGETCGSAVRLEQLRLSLQEKQNAV